MTRQISSREWELLSAYLDGELTYRERSRLEEKLEVRVELRAALDELRQTTTILRSQPTVRAPRNFTLTPQMVGLHRTVRSNAQLFPVMRLTAVLASMFFVFALLGDLFWVSPLTTAPMFMEEPVTQMARIEEEILPGVGSEDVVEKALEKEGLADLEVAEAEQALDVAAVPAERAPAIEMPAAEAEGYPLPTEKATIAEAPPATLAYAEPTTLPTEVPPIPLEEEVVLTDESLEPQLVQVQEISRNLRVLRILEVILAIMGVTTGLVAFYLRPKRKV